jgi:predicted MPP superfamily phosphohydrolase
VQRPAAGLRRSLVLAALGAVAAGIAAAVWGFLFEPDLLRLRHIVVETAKWPPAVPPLRVAVVADIHAGAPYIDAAKLDRIVADVNAQDADVIVLLGDFLIQGVRFGTPMPPDRIAAHLRPLHARQGVFAVLGNHDWYGDGRRVWRELEAAGIRVLENQGTSLPGSDGRIWLAGVADDSTRTPDVAAALRGAPGDAAILVITHDPAVLPDVPPQVALTLAGHMHGGQVYLPLIGALFTPGRAPSRLAWGYHVEGGRGVFVTGGIGTSILPVRFNMPPEIVVVTLRRPPG